MLVAESTLVSMQNQSEATDKTALEAIQRVVDGVKSDPTEGNNSDLYQAMATSAKAT